MKDADEATDTTDATSAADATIKGAFDTSGAEDAISASSEQVISAASEQAAANLSKQQLAEAFELFNQMSESLSSNYQHLESQVQQLTHELTEAKALQTLETQESQRLMTRMQNLLDVLPGGVVLLDNRGIIQQCNPAAGGLLGEPLLGQRWVDVISRAFAPRRGDGHEISLKDGRLIRIATTSLDAEPGQLMLLTDLTETRALQAHMAQHDRLLAMGRMMASLAHQIRTPLSAALLYAGHLSNPDLNEEKRVPFAKKIKSRLLHLEKHIRDMLIFARGETQLNDLLTTPVLFERFQEAFEALISENQVDLKIINDAPEGRVLCNTDALTGAVGNLVSNAIEASGPGCRIQLSSRITAGNVLELAVQDFGPGMEQTIQDQARQPFYTTKPQGTGLGLAVAQVVARAHQGEFILESTLGEGTRASFRLPLR